MGSQTYTSHGTFTWVAPAGVTHVSVQCWGSGAGGLDGAAFTQAGDGGGGGEYAAELNNTCTPGNSYTVVVGQAGAASGGAAHNSSFTGTGATTVTAHGGSVGSGTGTGGAGGTGSTNTTHHNGGAGGGGSTTQNGGGGGSSAGTAAVGNNGANQSSGGAGGAAPAGGGPGGNGAISGNATSPASGPGGGGGGGSTISGGTSAAGFDGQVILKWTDPPQPRSSPVRARFPLPWRGRVYSNPGAPVNNAGKTVSLTTAQVNIAALAVTPTYSATVSLTTAQVNISAPAPTGKVAIPLTVAQVNIAARAPAGVVAVPLTVAQVNIAALAVTPKINIVVNLTTAQVNISAPAPAVRITRTLIVSAASQAGTDDYGNTFPQGLMAGGNSEFLMDNGILNSNGLFLYSGTPASGNMVVSISQNTGTDAYGNGWLQGYVTYQSGFGGSYLATQVWQGTMEFWESNTFGGWIQVGASITLTTGGEIELQGTGIQLPSSNINGHAVDFAFLSQLGKMNHVSETNTGGWTPGGAINGSAQINTTALTTWMNEVNTDIGNILSALQSKGYMS